MNQNERLNYIVDTLCKDSVDYKDMKVEQEQKRKLMRSLMNIRSPKPISSEFLKVQDDFLSEEAVEKGIVSLADIPTIGEDDCLSIWQGDITRLKVGAIVNAANSEMLGCFVPCHGCIDNAIHSAAGLELRAACNEYMTQMRKVHGDFYEEPVGSAVVTKGYNLPCDHVIHTVGPIVYGVLTDKHKKALESCYLSCLKKADEEGIDSIAFCCISTGEFHFPNKEAAKIAVATTKKYLEQHPGKIKRVIFNVFKDQDLTIYEELLRK